MPDRKGIRIYNATSSDSTEVFEGVDLDFLLGEESNPNFNLIHFMSNVFKKRSWCDEQMWKTITQ